jgi:hypothetical protein
LFQSNDTKEGKSKKSQYEGPDGDLAAMLERDVLDSTPGVTWDDVAGHSEAKRLLIEAVMLPVVMPDYFQVMIYNLDYAIVWTFCCFSHPFLLLFNIMAKDNVAVFIDSMCVICISHMVIVLKYDVFRKTSFSIMFESP